jgi:16S rRNA C967 or C1407 C5-methylase (RsmB/RsmF family)
MDFRKRYDDLFGEDAYEDLLEAQEMYSQDQYVRINISKRKVSEIEKFLKSNRVKFVRTYIKNCLRIEKSFFNLSSSLEALSGEIYMQDIASQIPVNLIDYDSLLAKGRSIKILDMAASPGSKTTQIADMMAFFKIDCEITALDPEVKRLRKLVSNIQKQNFRNISVINVKGEDFKTSDKFDVILLDTPCSGNLIGDTSWLKKRDIEGIRANAVLQKKLLKKASELLAEDGLLLYSTCSMEPEENEENVEYAQKELKLKSKKSSFEFPFETRPEKLVDRKFMKQESIRLFPYLSESQGFFVCLLEK